MVLKLHEEVYSVIQDLLLLVLFHLTVCSPTFHLKMRKYLLYNSIPVMFVLVT